MRVIGVTGGIGAGKSEVLDYLQCAHGACVQKLDELANEMLQPGGRNYQPYISLLGNEIVRADGSLDRKRIAARIFSDEALLLEINAIVNPAVKEELILRMERAKSAKMPLFVIESAILFNEHYDAFCDETWYIDADDAVRRARLRASRGYDDRRIDDTMKRQMDADSFLKACTFRLNNNGSFEDTKRRIDARLLLLEKEQSGAL